MRARGLTLIELLVALLILSILAAAALPYAELTVRRGKELELRRSLRDIRGAIDALHEDWTAGRASKLDDGVSEDGYPKTLDVLVTGVDTGQARGGRRKYLRRIPADPFANPAEPPETHWILRGYEDEVGAPSWNGRDVYDVRSASERQAIDGTWYQGW